MRSRLAVSAVLVVCAATVAGCGGASGIAGRQGSPGSVVQARAAGADLTSAGLARTLAHSVARAESVHVAGHVTAGRHEVKFAVDQARSGTVLHGLRVRAHAVVDGSSVTLLVVDGAAYVRAPELLGDTHSKSWLGVHLGGAGQPLAQAYHRIASRLQLSHLPALLRSAAAVRDLGPQVVHGVRATHYRLRLNTDRLARTFAGPGLDLGLRKPDVGRRTVTADLWLDARGLPVQLTAATRGVSATLSFSHWGESVTVQAPPAAEVGWLSR